MSSVATYSSSLNSLLAGMLARTPGAAHAVLATVDGVSVAVSAGLPPERAEQLATIGAGLLSIADGAGIMMNTGQPRHVIVEMYGGAALGDKHQLRQQYMSMGFYLPKILAAARLNALDVQGVSLQERG